MKRYIKSSDIGNDYDEWSPFHGHKYRIDGGYDIKYADTPSEALQIWFQLSRKHPTDTAIMTPKREFAIKLCKAATSDRLTKLHEKYGSPYKLDYLIDEAAKGVSNGCKSFYEGQDDYGDQIHPFCYG